MDSLISTVVVILIAVTSFSIVLTAGVPLIEKSLDSIKFSEAEKIFSYIDNCINEVANEGPGASRILKFRTDAKNFRVSSQDNSIEVEMGTAAKLMDYYSRSIHGNIIQVSGNDMSCTNTTSAIAMGNSYISVILRHTPQASPMAVIDTSGIIANITEKRSGRSIAFADSSIAIDENEETSSGVGYTELVSQGRSLCRAHAFVNSTVKYDVYYTLYAGADFLDIEIRNVV
ncbi:MAG: hypothetical protein HZB66_00220 [Candidatus Aenigmarchaeota archaeon]|nr:hypothetical protein [Candidatus Aenigmarchaeota archaeon]